jgi:hypothetical protein
MVILVIKGLREAVPTIFLGLTHALPLAQAQQMSPLGFSGAINSPTADVLPYGSLKMSYSNSIPELSKRSPFEPFGGFNAGFGVLPGLEVTGRLAFAGDVNCSQFDPTCTGRQRDLSISGKYQLPLQLPLNTQIAVGFTDYGGAATNYRSAYGVATSAVGPFDLSLGFAKKSSANALLDGVFGSARLHLTDKVQVVAENDSQVGRIGASFTQPITDQAAIQLGLSRKLSGAATQVSNQFTASLLYFYDKQVARKRVSDIQYATGASVAPASYSGPTAEQLRRNDQLTPAAQTEILTKSLKKSGFAQITVRHANAQGNKPASWHLTVEPILKRQAQAQAIGSALATWMEHIGSAPANLTLELTYMGQMYRRVSTTRACLISFARGSSQCDQGEALQFDQAPRDDADKQLQTLTDESRSLNLRPQFEAGLNLRTAVGTEVGLFDYSLALDLGAQVQLAQGLFAQGNVHIPTLQSDDFREFGNFRFLGHPKARVEQGLVSYARPVKIAEHQIQTQLSAGVINAFNRGFQADALWFDPTGKWRIGGTAGSYNNDGQKVTPLLLSLRRSIIPGEWALEGMAGEFLGGDKGWLVRSQHWMGDTIVGLFLHSSKGGTVGNKKISFAGISVSAPLSAFWQKDFGLASVRGQDRLGWSLRTKVGETDNAVSGGAAEIPRARHGVWTDFSDFDRGGVADAWARRNKIRDAMLSPQ